MSDKLYRCPQCGGNCWGTYRAPNGVEWGRCQGHANKGEVGDGTSCGFVWPRDQDWLVFTVETEDMQDDIARLTKELADARAERDEADEELSVCRGIVNATSENLRYDLEAMVDERADLRARFEIAANALLQAVAAEADSLPAKAESFLDEARKTLADYHPADDKLSDLAAKLRLTIWSDERLKKELDEANARWRSVSDKLVDSWAERDALQAEVAKLRAEQNAVAKHHLDMAVASILESWSKSIERKKEFDVNTSGRAYWQGCADSEATWVQILRARAAALTAPAQPEPQERAAVKPSEEDGA